MRGRKANLYTGLLCNNMEINERCNVSGLLVKYAEVTVLTVILFRE